MTLCFFFNFHEYEKYFTIAFDYFLLNFNFIIYWNGYFGLFLVSVCLENLFLAIFCSVGDILVPVFFLLCRKMMDPSLTYTVVACVFLLRALSSIVLKE